MPQTDHYETLGVARDATPEQIKDAFRREAKKAHPDRHQEGEARAAATQRMQAVNQAYAVLGDLQSRARYDAGGSGDEQPSAEELARRAAWQELSRLFIEALNLGDGDPLEAIRKSVRDGHAEGRLTIARIKQRIKRLTGKRELVRRKDGGENMLQALIDGKIAEANRELVGNERAMRVGDAMLALVDEYEYLEPARSDDGIPFFVGTEDWRAAAMRKGP